MQSQTPGVCKFETHETYVVSLLTHAHTQVFATICDVSDKQSVEALTNFAKVEIVQMEFAIQFTRNNQLELTFENFHSGQVRYHSLLD